MAKRKAECRYCGKETHGPGCQFGPEGIHVEVGDPDHCIYCGSTSYGPGCQFSIEEKHTHKHGHGDRKCIWCGKSGVSGPGCMFSPTGKHEF